MAGDLQMLEEAVSALLEGIGVDLVDVELRQGTLCVTVTREAGLDLDALTLASRAVSDLLDEREELAPDEPYELEVSSPGLERRLRRPSHFAGALGQTVAVRTTGGTPGPRRLEGVLTAADDVGISVRDSASGEAFTVAYGSIDRAHTVFDWQAALAADKRSRAAADGNEAGRPPAGQRTSERTKLPRESHR